MQPPCCYYLQKIREWNVKVCSHDVWFIPPFVKARQNLKIHTHTRTHTTPNADIKSPLFTDRKQTSKASGLKTGSARTHRSVYRFLTSRQRVCGDTVTNLLCVNTGVKLTGSNYQFLKNQSSTQLNRGAFIDSAHNKQFSRNVTISAATNLQVK
jgi:hypothetical protein